MTCCNHKEESFPNSVNHKQIMKGWSEQRWPTNTTYRFSASLTMTPPASPRSPSAPWHICVRFFFFPALLCFSDHLLSTSQTSYQQSRQIWTTRSRWPIDAPESPIHWYLGFCSLDLGKREETFCMGTSPPAGCRMNLQYGRVLQPSGKYICWFFLKKIVLVIGWAEWSFIVLKLAIEISTARGRYTLCMRLQNFSLASRHYSGLPMSFLGSINPMERNSRTQLLTPVPSALTEKGRGRRNMQGLILYRLERWDKIWQENYSTGIHLAIE